MSTAIEQNWEAQVTGEITLADGGTQNVYQVTNGRWLIAEFMPEDVAKLAAAAPDLYRALKNLLMYAAQEIGVEPDEAIGGYFREARAALTKANPTQK
jgi:hypothetical protein